MLELPRRAKTTQPISTSTLYKVETDPDHARMASLAANQGTITVLKGQNAALREDLHGLFQLGQISTSLFLVVQLTLELLVQYSFSIQITFLIWLVGRTAEEAVKACHFAKLVIFPSFTDERRLTLLMQNSIFIVSAMPRAAFKR
ncbi:hypothetical protein ACS64U_004298 [Pseudomonas aeruginosa]